MKYFIFFLLLLFVACTHKEVQSTLKKMDTPVSSMMSPINLSEIASSVKCIPLAMQDSIVMDELTQVIVKDSFIYAADRASLYKFSLTGELMSVVNHRGSSPTEYINISDFQVDENGNVWVLSRNNKALFNYSWDGNLHKKISLDTWFERFSIINGEKMLLYAGNEKSNEYRHTLYILDLQKEKIVNRYLEIINLCIYMLNHQIIFLTVGILVSFIRCLMIQYIHLIREAYQPRNIYYLLQIRIFLLLFMNKNMVI